MWIEFTEDRGTFKKGQRVDKADESANTLIEAGIAKACEAPETPESATKALESLVEATAQRVAVETVKEAVKGLGTIKTNFRDVNEGGYELGTAKKFTLPANVKRYSSLRNFKGANAEERAYRFGMYCLALYGLNGRIADPERQEEMNRYVKRAKSMGIPVLPAGRIGDEEADVIVGKDVGVVTKASNENTNSSSAFLVPEEFNTDLIDLREKFGVFRQNAKIVPMASDTRSDPRRRGGLQYYFVGEDQAGTQSTKTWDRVGLKAKKLMVLSKFSNELNEDAVLNIADDLAEEIAYTFAYAEDQCGFLGDGTSTYGGIVGATKALTNVDATVGNVLGLTVASGTGYGTSYNSIVLGDFNKVIASLPEYADNATEAKFYCSKFFWAAVMQKLEMAAGGNRVMDIQNGALRKTFAGYEVVISQAMPKTSATNQVCCLFGNLRKAASLGDRRQTRISISDVALNSFEQDEIAVRGTERFDINVHDVG